MVLDDKARAQRMERMKATLGRRLDQPQAVLEMLLTELKGGERQPTFWDDLHAAAARDGKEKELREAYERVISPRRLQQLEPWAQAEMLMNAANFHLGVLGDVVSAQALLHRVLEVAPDHLEAFSRLERRYTQDNDGVRLVDLYSRAIGVQPRTADELARLVVNLLVPLPARTPLADETCRRLVALASHHASVIDVLEAHCKKTNRAVLACELLELVLADRSFPVARTTEIRRRIVELAIGPAALTSMAMTYVEQLLESDASDAVARKGAEALLKKPDVARRAAAVLQKLRSQARG